MANAETFTLKRNGNHLGNGELATAADLRALAIRRMLPRSAFFLQVLADLIVIIGSMLLGYWFYNYLFVTFGIGKAEQPLNMYFRLTLITAVIMLVIFERLGLYRRTMSIMNIEEIKGIFKALFYTAVLLFTASFYFKDISYSRLIVTYALVFLMFFLNIERYIAFKIFQSLHEKGIGVNRALIYGAGEAGQTLVERFVRSPRLGWLTVGFIDDNPELWNKPLQSRSDEVRYTLPVLGGFDQLLAAATRHNIDELFICLPSVSQTRIAQIIRRCEQIGLKFYFMPNLFDYKMQHIEMRTLDGVPLLTVKESRISAWNLFFKRVMDLAITIPNLMLLSPLMITVALLVKKTSPGPVYFKHERVGLHGKKFIMYKFRSMYQDTPKYALTPQHKGDPRITPIGRFLRRTSLDELPQLFNVLKGEMSIVGPRPEQPFIVDSYDDVQRDRLKVKPGITGLWQISADRAKEIHANIEYDLYYVENCSPLLDLAIIIRTLFGIIKGKGAY